MNNKCACVLWGGRGQGFMLGWKRGGSCLVGKEVVI